MTYSQAPHPRRVLVTATPPTPNGDLHVGHLSGPYLAGDIYCRYLRLKGIDCSYLSGSDDHQSYTTFKGEQLGWTPAAVADHFGDAMHKTLEAAKISLDVYARPRTSAYHIPFVQDFFLKLYRENKLITRKAASLFCDRCGRYVFEAFVSGKCPHCHSPSGGNACEDCGRPNDCVDLIDPACKACGSRPRVVLLERVYFPLSRYADQLRTYYKTAGMNPHLRALCEQMLLDGLPDIALTHHTTWGIPVPVKGFEDQRLYVWFEMAPGFLAATQELSRNQENGAGWTDIWKDAKSKVVQFFGFDNGYFFAVLFPALLLAYDPEIRPAQTFVTNEFYRLDGLKFSTSRNHAIWGRQLLEEASSDAVRFYLAYTGPEREQCNFTRQDFYSTVERELAGAWQSWLQDLGARVRQDHEGRIPAVEGLEEEQQVFLDTLRSLLQQAEASYCAETFSPQQAARICCEIVRLARRFGKSENHWRIVPGRAGRKGASVALELLAAKVLAVASAPIMPVFAARLWEALGCAPSLLERCWDDALTPLSAGTVLAPLNTLGLEISQENHHMVPAIP